MSEELKPCPFCDGVAYTDKTEGIFAGQCQECCSEGTPCDTEVEAITAWNTRAGGQE